MTHEELFSHRNKHCNCYLPKDVQKVIKKTMKDIIKEMRVKEKEFKKTGWKNDGMVDRYVSMIYRKS